MTGPGRVDVSTLPRPGQVQDPETGALIPRGEMILRDALDKPIDLEANLKKFQQNQVAVHKFCREYLQEAAYDQRGYLIPGQLHDYYMVPGTPTKALTKKGAEKICSLFRYAKGKTEVSSQTEGKEYSSATVTVTLVDHYGRLVGSATASCTSAEKGFQAIPVRKKYGATTRSEGQGNERREVETSPPDYRAAMNDIVAKAGKRAFVQATIVATVTDEIFHPASDTKERVQTQGETPSGAAATLMPMKWEPHPKGTPLSALSQEELVKVKTWCKAKGKFADLIEAIDDTLDERRPAGIDEEEAAQAGAP